jgi:hypothetical protein
MPRGLAGLSRTSAPPLYQARVRDLSRHQQASHGLLSKLSFFSLLPGLIQGPRSCCRLILLDHGCGDQFATSETPPSSEYACRSDSARSNRIEREHLHRKSPPFLWLAHIIN